MCQGDEDLPCWAVLLSQNAATQRGGVARHWIHEEVQDAPRRLDEYYKGSSG